MAFYSIKLSSIAGPLALAPFGCQPSQLFFLSHFLLGFLVNWLKIFYQITLIMTVT